MSPGSSWQSTANFMSEVAGRSTVLAKISKLAPHLTKDSKEVDGLVHALKELGTSGLSI